MGVKTLCCTDDPANTEIFKITRGFQVHLAMLVPSTVSHEAPKLLPKVHMTP